MDKPSRSIFRPIATCFLTGLIAILPLVVTVSVVIWVAAVIRQFIGPETFVGDQLRGLGIRLAGSHAETAAYAIGWFAVLVAIFGLGVLMELGAKKLFSRLLERLMRRIPLVSSIYSTSKQMIDLFANDSVKADVKEMMSPVLCHFGDSSSPAVLALLASPDRYLVDEQEYRMVVIPTAPIPFGGALLMLPSEKVRAVDISIDGLVSIYASMGITGPKYLKVRCAEPRDPASTLPETA